jgi:hypothetical protein
MIRVRIPGGREAGDDFSERCMGKHAMDKRFSRADRSTTSARMCARIIAMKRILPIFAALFLLLAASAAYSQSLADLAKKEKERREKITSDSKVITNSDTAKYRAGPVTTEAPVAAASGQKAEPGNTGPEGDAASKPPKAESDEPVDFQGRPESFWRQTMADARQQVKNLENEANVLTLRIADLQNQFYREANGFRQQEIQREIQKSFYEQDKNKEELAKARDQLQDLEKEARKSGALPGWLTPKTP